MRTLTAIIPVYNQREALPATLDALAAALRRSGFEAEILVVDDGSTDGTADAVRAWAGAARVIEQPNAGRFAARQRGLEATEAEYCLLIDSRVRIAPDALAFVEEQLAEDMDVWNAHVDIETAGNPFGVFWDVITRRAFSAYFREPRTTSFGLDDFERFPKGTTCFFAPRALLVAAFREFRTGYRDIRNANDDTPVIRWIAARRRINISPRFSCVYEARQKLRPFLRHAYHRGIVFFDGHGRRESRWFPIVVGFYPSTVVWILASVVFPPLVLAPFVLASVGGAFLALTERNLGAAATMVWVTPLYASAHALGMWKGLLLAMFAKGRE